MDEKIFLGLLATIIVSQIVIFLALMVLVQEVDKVKTARLWGDNPIYERVKASRLPR
jgi:hypothetical protein